MKEQIRIIWALGGFLTLLTVAIYRLSLVSIEAFRSPLSPLHYFTLVSNLLFMLYFEGYKGFHQNFSPRFAARLPLLQQAGVILRAPLFCMGYFASTAQEKRRAYFLTLGIVILVLIVRTIPQPWRGIIDSGVCAALLCGILSVVYHSIKILQVTKIKASS